MADDGGRVPMSPGLQTTLLRAREYAASQSEAQVLLEHLLLALSEDADAAHVLQACEIDLGRLRHDVAGYLGSLNDRVPPGTPGAPAISPALTQVLKYATLAAQQGRRSSIDGAIVLAALVGDGRSMAANFLKAQGLTFEAAIQALREAASRGAGHPHQPPQPRPAAQPAPYSAPPPDTADAAGHPEPHFATTSRAEDILARARERVETRNQGAETKAAGPGPVDTETAPPRPPVTTTQAPPSPPGSPPRSTQPQPRDEQPPVVRSTIPNAEAIAQTPPQTPRAALHEPERHEQELHEPELHEPERPEPPQISEPAAASQSPADTSSAPRTPSPERAREAPQAQFPVPAASYEDTAEWHPVGPSEPAALRQEREPRSLPPKINGADRPLPGPTPQHWQEQPPANQAAPTGWTPPPMRPPSPPSTARQHPQPPQTWQTPPLPPAQSPPPPGPASARLPDGDAHPSARWARPTLPIEPYREPQQPTGYAPPALVPAQSGPGYAASNGARPAIDETQITHSIPRRLRQGRAQVVEVWIERPPIAGSTVPSRSFALRPESVVARAIAVRLRPLSGRFIIDAASPETQWDQNGAANGADRLVSEAAVWRFSVTPLQAGKCALHLAISARTLGADGVLAETQIPDQTFEIRSSRSYGATVKRAAVLASAALAGMLLVKLLEGLLHVDFFFMLKQLLRF